MSFVLGTHSELQLQTCHPNLQLVIRKAITITPIDFKVVEGFRGQAEQDRAYHTGKSKVRWPNGKHNQRPCTAVDVYPVPIDWADRDRFLVVAGAILTAANLVEVKLRWGGDWDSDGKTTDETFRDLGHFELVQLPLMG